MKVIDKRASLERAVLGWLFRWQAQSETARVNTSEAEASLGTLTRSDEEGCGPQEPAEVVAQGVIRREEVPLLARYGTSYGLFDGSIADYECLLKSDVYRLGEYVGDSVRVSGALAAVIEGVPVMEVTRLQLLKMKWMR